MDSLPDLMKSEPKIYHLICTNLWYMLLGDNTAAPIITFSGLLYSHLHLHFKQISETCQSRRGLPSLGSLCSLLQVSGGCRGRGCLGKSKEDEQEPGDAASVGTSPVHQTAVSSALHIGLCYLPAVVWCGIGPTTITCQQPGPALKQLHSLAGGAVPMDPATPANTFHARGRAEPSSMGSHSQSPVCSLDKLFSCPLGFGLRPASSGTGLFYFI